MAHLHVQSFGLSICIWMLETKIGEGFKTEWSQPVLGREQRWCRGEKKTWGERSETGKESGPTGWPIYSYVPCMAISQACFFWWQVEWRSKWSTGSFALLQWSKAECISESLPQWGLPNPPKKLAFYMLEGILTNGPSWGVYFLIRCLWELFVTSMMALCWNCLSLYHQ